MGNRVEKSNGTLYWYGQGGEVLDETDLSGNLKDEYVFFGGRRIAERDSSGNVYYYVEDHLGSSRVMVQAGQTPPCYDADFLPYGQEVDYTDTCGSRYKFQGKERDTETDNDNFGARYYRSLVGRFLSPDWSAIPAPMPYANLTNPQTLNLYAMVSDNPETFADLDGHKVSAGGASGGGSGDSGPGGDAAGTSSGGNCAGGVTGCATDQNPANQVQAQQQTPSQWPHGGGVGAGASADAGVVVTGASGTVSVSAGVFYKPGKGVSVGATATGGAVAYAGKKDAGAPTQDRAARNLGAYAGGGVSAFVTNATSASQLKGHFTTSTVNVGLGTVKFSVQLSTGHGIWELSVGPPIPYASAGIGGSLSRITTETCSAPGGC